MLPAMAACTGAATSSAAAAPARPGAEKEAASAKPMRPGDAKARRADEIAGAGRGEDCGERGEGEDQRDRLEPAGGADEREIERGRRERGDGEHELAGDEQAVAFALDRVRGAVVRNPLRQVPQTQEHRHATRIWGSKDAASLLANSQEALKRTLSKTRSAPTKSNRGADFGARGGLSALMV